MLISDSDELSPVGCIDFDFMSNKDSRKSTSGYVFMQGGRAFIWRSVKWDCTSYSTSEVEYVAACEVPKEAVLLKWFLLELGVVSFAVTTAYSLLWQQRSSCPIQGTKP